MEGPKAFLRPALKPIVKELVRTQVCFPNIQLLLDRIMVAKVGEPADRGETEAFRLYLSDGEKSIQALVKRRLYKMIVSNEVCEGSYLQIKEYALASARKIIGEGCITYIALKDFYPIGHDGRSSQEGWAARSPSMTHTAPSADVQPGGQVGLLHVSQFAKQHNNSVAKPSRTIKDRDQLLESKTVTNSMAVDDALPKRAASPSQQRKRKHHADDALGEIDPNSQSSPAKSAKRRHDSEGRIRHVDYGKEADDEAALATGERGVNLKRSSADPASSNQPSCTFESLFCAQSTSSRPTSRSDKRPRPIMTPLRLMSLSSLKGYRRRNDIYDVFAVIYSVSDMVVKRSRMPAKRDVRIVDPSTDKKVLLSVFVDPANFKPRVGQIALMRNLTTHEWDGGMLNAYPKQCEGTQWFIPDPQAIAGCNTNFMREWWTDRVIEEAEERMKEEQLKNAVSNGETRTEELG